MTRHLVSACAFALIAGLSFPVSAEELPLKRVTLSTSGLAQFEHQGDVTGNAVLTLPVRLDQVDDVLKSLVVLDEKGSFGGVSLPGREPLDQIFRDLPFKRQDLDTLTGLLQSLQGSSVQVTDGTGISGRLVNVVAEQSLIDDKQVVRRHRIGIMTDEGMKTVLLENLKTLKFTEKNVQDQLDRALAALHDHRVQDQRALTLDLRGDGARPVTVSYVTAAPLWKSAYRLVLPEKNSDTAYMQGWAILENTTGQDWDDVQITLLSGNPVTYKQSLYESYYRDRPTLPLRVMDRLMPRTDEGGVAMQPEARGAAFERKAEMNYAREAGAAKAVAPMAAQEMYAMADSATSAAMPMPAALGGMAPPMEMAGAQTAIAEQATAQMVFRFPQSVDLPAGNSLMLPVISRDIPAEPLWLYQPATSARHPLTAVALKNDSETGLPPGILTLFERGQEGLRYTGDAELALLPKGEKRYITFALDPATTIDREISGDRTYGTFRAAKGVITQSVVSTETAIYTIKAPADEDRVLVIEHPRRPGWELQIPEGLEGDPETTETDYRLKLALKAGETRTLKVTLEHQETEQLSIGYMAPGDLAARLSGAGGAIDPKVRKALEGAVALQSNVYELQMQMEKLTQDRQNIFNDQARLRENLKSIPSSSDIAKRYLGELNAQEDALARLKADERTLQGKLDDARRKLDAYVMGLEL